MMTRLKNFAWKIFFYLMWIRKTLHSWWMKNFMNETSFVFTSNKEIFFMQNLFISSSFFFYYSSYWLFDKTLFFFHFFYFFDIFHFFDISDFIMTENRRKIDDELSKNEFIKKIRRQIKQMFSFEKEIHDAKKIDEQNKKYWLTKMKNFNDWKNASMRKKKRMKTKMKLKRRNIR